MIDAQQDVLEAQVDIGAEYGQGVTGRLGTGLVTQQVVGVRDLSDLGPLLQKIQTTGFIREIRTVEPTNGADDEIHGNDGRDRIFGGHGDDTIAGDDQANVVFGDHGRLVYTAGPADGSVDVTILHLVESIDTESDAIQAMALCPTRELANQVAVELTTLGKYRGVEVLPVYGGVAYGTQIDALERGVHIIVGTPGRILDHLGNGRIDDR